LTESDKLGLNLYEDEEKYLKLTYKNSDICEYHTDLSHSGILYIIYVARDAHIKKFPAVEAHLEKYKEILQDRLRRYGENHPWYSLHRERNEHILSSKYKIVTPRWGKDLKPFALQTGKFYENSDINVMVPKSETREDILYLLGLLNSSLLKRWMTEKAKQKGLTRQSALFRVPIRRIDFNNREDVRLHDEIVKKVKIIRNKMVELAGYSKYFKGPRLTRLKPEDSLPQMDPESIIKTFPPEKRFCLRTHPHIKMSYSQYLVENRFILSKVGEVTLTLEGPELELAGKDEKIIIIKGSEEILRVISLILLSHKNESWSNIKEIPFIPEKTTDYGNAKKEVLQKVATLRTEIQKFQTSINSIVFKLYDVSEKSEKQDSLKETLLHRK